MDNKAIRKANVAWLVQQHHGPTEFGKVIERDQVQVSQWLGGKPIGDRLARHIEDRLGRPHGWLDVPQWELGIWETTPGLGSQPQRLDVLMITRAADALLQFLHRRDPNAALDLRDEGDADLFAEAYLEAVSAAPTEAGSRAFGAAVSELITRKRPEATDGSRDQQAARAPGGKARQARTGT